MASFQAGFNARIRINSQVFAAASWNARSITQDLDITNTEGIPGNPSIATPSIAAEGAIPGTFRMEAQVRNACFDANSNPFAAPITLDSGIFYSLRIYLNGTSGVSWYAQSFLTRDVSTDGDVKGLQPVSFNGRSDGGFSTPEV